MGLRARISGGERPRGWGSAGAPGWAVPGDPLPGGAGARWGFQGAGLSSHGSGVQGPKRRGPGGAGPGSPGGGGGGATEPGRRGRGPQRVDDATPPRHPRPLIGRRPNGRAADWPGRRRRGRGAGMPRGWRRSAGGGRPALENRVPGRPAGSAPAAASAAGRGRRVWVPARAGGVGGREALAPGGLQAPAAPRPLCRPRAPSCSTCAGPRGAKPGTPL